MRCAVSVDVFPVCETRVMVEVCRSLDSDSAYVGGREMIVDSPKDGETMLAAEKVSPSMISSRFMKRFSSYSPGSRSQS